MPFKSSFAAASILALTAILFIEVEPTEVEAAAQYCAHYTNSRPSYIGGQQVCAYQGLGCSECSNDQGQSCTVSTTGYTGCEPFDDYPYP